MIQTWRWFGENDPVSIEDIEQAGAQGVVTALHHIKNGDVWTAEEITLRQNVITRRTNGERSNLCWEVVESLNVSEDIKKQDGEWRTHVRHYIQSLENLAAADLKTVCYNFMPVLDWTRTDLNWRLPNGGHCMRFDYVDFAAFDLYILKRLNAEVDFSAETIHHAHERFNQMSEQHKKDLQQNIVAGLPGASQRLSLSDVNLLLDSYSGIDEAKLRQNHYDFLEQVVPTAERLGVRMCCHPDDPPFSLLGLPRIMSTQADYERMLQAVDSVASGMTLCSGSLGANNENDVVGIMQELGDKVYFLHLRNVVLESPASPGSFHESEHLKGSTDMVGLISAILQEENRRRDEGLAHWNIPMRPDHGHHLLDDLRKASQQPGYPAIGRLKGLAELRGVITALSA